MLELKQNHKDHITIRMSLLTWIKINVSVINAEECYWLFTNAFHSSFDSEWAICHKPICYRLLNEHTADFRQEKTTAHICVVQVCVINLREIALSPAVLDSNTLSTININIHQILNIFSSPWYRPMGIKLFINAICRTEEKCLATEEGKKRIGT